MAASAADPVDARVVTEDIGDRAAEPIDQSVLAVVVVHREPAAGREVVACGCDGFRGEQVGLQADRARAVDQHEGVRQREQDQVVLGVRLLEERPTVVDVGGDARVLVGPVRVPLLADLQDPRVDLDRVNMLGALGQRDRHVAAGARTDDQHATQPVAGEPLVRHAVLRLLQQLQARRAHHLMRDAVDRDAQLVCAVGAGNLIGLHLVVGRPADAGSGTLEHQQSDHRQGRKHCRHGDPGPQQHEERRSHHRAPDE